MNTKPQVVKKNKHELPAIVRVAWAVDFETRNPEKIDTAKACLAIERMQAEMDRLRMMVNDTAAMASIRANHPEECQCSTCWSDERIAALRGHNPDDAADAVHAQLECLGHETTEGPIGQTVYCDGTCRTCGVDLSRSGHAPDCENLPEA